jgi:hypothetical protein
VLVAALFVAITPVLASASCDHGGSDASGGSSTATVGATLPVRPACTILCVGELIDNNLPGGRRTDAIFLSERVASNPDDHFTPFHPISGPVGNPNLGPFDSANTDGISEVWQRFPGSSVVYRALATPAARTNLEVRTTLCGGYCKDNRGSAWQIQAQDATGTWSPVFGRGSANSGTDLDSPEVGGLTVPQLMTVGVANPQVFACAGGRTQDFRARTTYLIEAMAPGTSGGGTGGTVATIEDLLNGDRFYTFNSPLQSPTPPTPRVYGPGDPTGTVRCSVRCASSGTT